MNQAPADTKPGRVTPGVGFHLDPGTAAIREDAIEMSRVIKGVKWTQHRDGLKRSDLARRSGT